MRSELSCLEAEWIFQFRYPKLGEKNNKAKIPDDFSFRYPKLREKNNKAKIPEVTGQYTET